MGSLIKIWKTIPIPAGAKVGRTGTVTWTVKGKKRTGKMSASPGRVTVQSDTWTAQFTDETGKFPAFAAGFVQRVVGGLENVEHGEEDRFGGSDASFEFLVGQF